jgi:DNA-binding response OmpR family regulator
LASTNQTKQSPRVKILVVDDDQDILDSVCSGLELPGVDFDLMTANTGLKGLQLAKLHQPQVIILDLQMPDLSGFDLVRELKRDRQLGAMRFLMLTALDTPRNLWQSVDMGVDDFLGKPFDLRELEARLLNLLGD